MPLPINQYWMPDNARYDVIGRCFKSEAKDLYLAYSHCHYCELPIRELEVFDGHSMVLYGNEQVKYTFTYHPELKRSVLDKVELIKSHSIAIGGTLWKNQ